jgi:hypothetical protein
MSAWVMAVGNLLQPLYEALKKEILQSRYLQADETRMQVLDATHTLSKIIKKKPPGKTHRGYFWAFYAPLLKLALFEYQAGRGAEFPEETLKGYQGKLQTDGYVVYDAFDKKEGIELVGCLAHVRRKFFEAKGNDPKRAELALAFIQKLYQVERFARENNYTSIQRRGRRLDQAKPIWEKFKIWLTEQALDPKLLPKSAIAQAVNYALKRAPYIERYLDDGKLEIDNNLVENQIRPVALGRKNYLFAGSEKAAQNAAIIYSLLASCKQNQIDPFTWLRDVLQTLPDYPVNQVADLLPHRWQPNPNIDPRLQHYPTS